MNFSPQRHDQQVNHFPTYSGSKPLYLGLPQYYLHMLSDTFSSALLPDWQANYPNFRNANSTTPLHDPDDSPPNPATHLSHIHLSVTPQCLNSPNQKPAPIPYLAWTIHMPRQSLLAMFRHIMLPQFSG